ncbi:CASP-like protein 5C1 [Nymphaea thermarum]|nr:CASP-like protein 5C1 [Nymphaea thermarum]
MMNPFRKSASYLHKAIVLLRLKSRVWMSCQARWALPEASPLGSARPFSPQQPSSSCPWASSPLATPFSVTHLCVPSICSNSYLVTIVSFTIFWSFALAVIDLFTMVTGCKNLRQRGFMIIIAIGDWRVSSSISKVTKYVLGKRQVLSLLSLSAPCSSAGVADFLLLNGAPLCPPKNCSNGRYQLSAAMAFLSWFLILVSSLVNFWMLASL